MLIFFKSDSEFKSSRVYLVNQKDKNVINETFNKLYNQDKMQWINQFTFYNYSIFVIWRQLSDDFRKDKVVVDIRGLNKITEFDFYSLSLQSDITSAVTRFSYIFIMNGNDYFHQFLVRYKNRHKFIIISHRE